MSEENESADKSDTPVLFREKVVDRLSSPEQMDLLMTVTDRKSWLALIGFSIVVIATIIWAFWGTIPQTVNAQGILLQKGGIFTLQAATGGSVSDVLVDVGDFVELGQVVAHIDQDELLRELELLEQQVSGLELRHNQLENYGEKSQVLEDAKVNKERESAKSAVRAAQNQLQVLNERLRAERKLFRKGLITKPSLDRTRQEIQTVRQEKKRAETALKQISLTNLQTVANLDRELILSKQALDDGKKRLKATQARYEKYSKVVSPEKGVVTEIRVNKGTEVSLGMGLLNLEVKQSDVTDLQAVIYVPASEGKKIQPQMKVLLEPSIVKSQAWGYLVGEVLEVGKFPVSAEAMNRVLGNRALVQLFMSESPAVLAVKARILKNPKSYSGFEWTTGVGPRLEINAGTICNSRITVQERSPISLIFPMRHVREFKAHLDKEPKVSH